MLASHFSTGSIIPSNCIYCAFTSRKLLLQAQRSRISRCGPIGLRRSAAAFHRPLDESRGRSTRLSRPEGDNNHVRVRDVQSRRDGAPIRDRALRHRPGARREDAPKLNISRGDRHISFDEALAKQVKEAHKTLKETVVVKTIAREYNDTPSAFFDRAWVKFVTVLRSRGYVEDDVRSSAEATWQPGVYGDLKLAYEAGGATVLQQRISYAFLDGIMMPRFSEATRQNQQKLIDCRFPAEWYPKTRAFPRKFHMHVGPTNSGKTYQALQRLESAKEAGVYAGPLRLLAHEVYSRMNAKGLSCFLVTGEERRAPDHEYDKASEKLMTACTVEMIPLTAQFEVAVIDEIQMISDRFRGWAWTQAILGVMAKEIHLCGEERAVPLIQELCASMGEELTVHRYERLSPLAVAKQSLKGDLKNLRKGDCIVSFSVMGIQALKKQIEEKTGSRVAVVYGSLPAETRAQQAQLFNDPDSGYDYLVASDAIGMGLNLAIKRVIFETVAKHDGVSYRYLDIAHLKQIAGRAGRYRTAQQAADTSTSSGKQRQSIGLVTTLEDWDLPQVEKAMAADPPALTQAGVVPTADMIERFAAYFPPETPFSYIMQKLWHLSYYRKTFFVCNIKDLTWVADAIERVRGMTVGDRYTFCALPAGGRKNVKWDDLLPAFARVIADQKGGELVDIAEMPLEVLDKKPPADKREYLRELEFLHQALVTYMWLSFRFAGLFPQRALAKHATELTEEKIATVLGSFSFTEKARLAVAAKRSAQLLQAEAQREAAQLAAENAALEKGIAADGLTLAAKSDKDDIGLEELEDAEQPGDAVGEAAADSEESANESADESAAKYRAALGLESDNFGVKHDGDPIAVRNSQHDGTGEQPSSSAAWRERQRPREAQGSHGQDDLDLRPVNKAASPPEHDAMATQRESASDDGRSQQIAADFGFDDLRPETRPSSSSNVS